MDSATRTYSITDERDADAAAAVGATDDDSAAAAASAAAAGAGADATGFPLAADGVPVDYCGKEADDHCSPTPPKHLGRPSIGGISATTTTTQPVDPQTPSPIDDFVVVPETPYAQQVHSCLLLCCV